MKIPIFVSSPTTLNDDQESSRRLIVRELDKLGLEARALGRSDYPTDFPLREVMTLARHCAGGVILGFSQFRADTGVWKAGTPEESASGTPLHFPTPWNHLEAGILASMSLPLLVFKEDDVSGGVFDRGVTDLFVHPMPAPSLPNTDRKALSAVFMKWQADVRMHYYR